MVNSVRCPSGRTTAIQAAVDQLLQFDQLDALFPVRVYQTGSGTSTNMNANEVVAQWANRDLDDDDALHPNDDVNKGQSSNDVIPSAIHVSTALAIDQTLIPAIEVLIEHIERRASEHEHTVKTGRTHLMDAVPITIAQEFRAWRDQLRACLTRLEHGVSQLKGLPLGGTAVGTGLNAPLGYAEAAVDALNEALGFDFECASNPFLGIGSQDVAVSVSGGLKTVAIALLKIANDLRWMGSGPTAGLGELTLQTLQPGSSIMPGKVNPVIPEAVAMACTQVIGHDTAITVAGQSSSFQLNVMLPLIATNLLESVDLLVTSAQSLAHQVFETLTVNVDHLQRVAEQNAVVITALNDILGYDTAAALVRRSYETGAPVLELVAEHLGEDLDTVTQRVNLLRMTSNQD